MRKRRVLLILAASAGLLLLSAAMIAWAVRLRVAARLIDQRFAAAGVPASYRIAGLDPWGARIDALRVGDPAHPDLVAGQVRVRFGYGRQGAFVAGVSARGVRLDARLDESGLHLGSLDKLLPSHGGGGAVLPDLSVRLADVGVGLSTPNGKLALSLDGSGNPRQRFTGRMGVTAARLRLGGCRLDGVAAAMRVGVRQGTPTLDGPIALAAVACPSARSGPGRVQARIETDPTFQRVAAQATLRGFAGAAGPARFTDLCGIVTAAGQFGRLDGTARLHLARVEIPEWSRRAAGLADPLAATPLGPLARRGTLAASRLFAGAAVTTALDGRLQGLAATVTVRRLIVAGPDGAWIRLASGGGFVWGPQGWRADGDLRTGGASLPVLQGTIRQQVAGGPITGTIEALPYSAGAARLVLAPTTFRWTDTGLRFAGAAHLDGPVPDGFVRGLAVPLDGEVRPDGTVHLGQGCRRVAIQALRAASIRLGSTEFSLCGAPLAARDADGRWRLDARTGPLTLSGRIGDGPASLTAAGLRLSTTAFAADRVAATLGDGTAPTRLFIERVNGGWQGGSFADAGGTISSVPIRLAQAGGQWTVAGGGLRLVGGVRISDTAPSPRFLPLSGQDAVLTFRDGTIAATATLAEPQSGAAVARVVLHHDLGRGVGGAVLAVDALRFQPKGLQPEALTPLTLGVIANVAGMVKGEAVIDWTSAGVTSHGTFGTDKLDLAAAFGPVTGVSGRIRFTDLLGLVSAPDQEVRVAEINPGVAINDGRVRFHLPGENKVAVDSAAWPFAGGLLRLEPTVLDLGTGAERRLTFGLTALDAAKFVQQLDFPNIAATGRFDGTLPMRFDAAGGHIAGGVIAARPPGGTLAYVGELSSARLGTMGKLAFDALKAIRYSRLDIRLDGRLDGEMVSLVSFTGVRQATPEQGLAARLIRNLPFRFNIRIQAPFRGLVGSARSYADPRLLLTAPAPVQPAASGAVP